MSTSLSSFPPPRIRQTTRRRNEAGSRDLISCTNRQCNLLIFFCRPPAQAYSHRSMPFKCSSHMQSQPAASLTAIEGQLGRPATFNACARVKTLSWVSRRRVGWARRIVHEKTTNKSFGRWWRKPLEDNVQQCTFCHLQLARCGCCGLPAE